MQDTCRNHTRNLQETNRKLPRNTQDTCRTHAGNITGTYRKHAGSMRETYRKPAGNLQEPCRKPARNLQETCRNHSGNLQETHRKLPGNIVETCNLLFLLVVIVLLILLILLVILYANRCIYTYIYIYGPQVTQVCCQHWLMYCYQLPAMPGKVGCWVVPLGSCWKDNEFFVHFMNLVMPWQHFFNNRFVISQVLDGVWQLCQHLHQIRHHCKSWEPPDIMRNYINWYKSCELCKINWHTQELQEIHKNNYMKHPGNM